MITRHFSWAELGAESLPAASDLPIPHDELRRRLTALCAAVLEPWRARLGGPIRVTSGVRGIARNTALGGDPTKPGQHCYGDAADVVPSTVALDEAWAQLVALVEYGELPIDQAILERDHIHVSHVCHREPRRSLLVEGEDGRVRPWRPAEAAIGTTTGLRATE